MTSPYPNPLAGFENAPPLPDTVNADGKSLFNGPLPNKLSEAYETFPLPIDSSNNGFDFHSMYKSGIILRNWLMLLYSILYAGN